jgi:hypothetical protein
MKDATDHFTGYIRMRGIIVVITLQLLEYKTTCHAV